MGSSESENDRERIFTVSQEQGLENEFPDEDPRDEVVIFGVKSIHDCRIRNTLEEEACMTSICIPSTKVPSWVLEAGGSPRISPLLLCRSDVPSSDIEAIEKLTSLKEKELCESGLEQHMLHVHDEIQSGPTRDSTEMSSDDWADMKDRLDIASLGGISNIDDEARLCSDVKIGALVKASEEIDENFPYIQREITSSSEHRLSQSEPNISDVENDEVLLGWKENAALGESENEREIASSEGFSPVHQLVHLFKTDEDSVCGVWETDGSILFATGCADISDPEKSVDPDESENEREIVGELKRVVDGLEKEARVKGGKDCEVMEDMGEKVKEVWKTLYGKGWDGERVGEEGRDWKDVDEVEYTREVRDLGLLRVVGRLKMDVDEQREEMGEDEDEVTLEERGIEKYEMDLMLPHPTEFDF
ncbi:hypothetical protein DID88_009276 [Monilinia fructigena]|uniref:Uncharacterized protein n=1 Tax=Monilinia fructigena TaxID=38457 RepID=A0A395IF87_9HELO|nr:hypothetical protein DID88_009276 [Monilinia fructigena]